MQDLSVLEGGVTRWLIFRGNVARCADLGLLENVIIVEATGRHVYILEGTVARCVEWREVVRCVVLSHKLQDVLI